LLEGWPAGWPTGWPVVADPVFYAVAVPAVLITGLSKSGFAAGFGSLATPLMALTLPAPQAAAIMLPLLMVMDVTGLQQMWRDRDPALLRQILPWGVLGVGLGALLFGLLSAKAVAGLLGALTLAFLAQRLFFPPRRDGHVAKPWVGRSCAAASGVTSFIAHAGGPPIMAYLLPLKMEPRIMASSMAVYFTVINAVKVVPYAAMGFLDLRNFFTSVLLMPLAPLGVWAGVWLVRRVQPTWFYRLAYTGMLLTGLKLLSDAFR
jgi:uncharacterized membrane protein YfcA